MANLIAHDVIIGLEVKNLADLVALKRTKPAEQPNQVRRRKTDYMSGHQAAHAWVDTTGKARNETKRASGNSCCMCFDT